MSHKTVQKENIEAITDHLLGYKEFMSTKLLLALEEIRESNLLYNSYVFRYFQ